MNLTEHREKVLITLAEIQKDIKYLTDSAKRTEKHLQKINGSVETHDRAITRIQTWGSAGLLLLPILTGILIRIFM